MKIHALTTRLDFMADPWITLGRRIAQGEPFKGKREDGAS
jgi:hypothetical protein